MSHNGRWEEAHLHSCVFSASQSSSHQVYKQLHNKQDGRGAAALDTRAIGASRGAPHTLRGEGTGGLWRRGGEGAGRGA